MEAMEPFQVSSTGFFIVSVTYFSSTTSIASTIQKTNGKMVFKKK